MAGPESLTDYTLDRRPDVAMWTADRAGRMRPGDVLLMYGTGRLQSYVAVARVCSDPRQNDRAQRLRKHREWWTYLQVQPLRSPIPRGEIESRAFAQHEGSGLQQPRGSRSNRVSPAALGGFAELLAERDPTAARRLTGWIAGRGQNPEPLDTEELRWADWDPPTTSPPEELRLSRQIAAGLVKSGDFRYVTAQDLGKPPRDDHRAYSFEHEIRDAAGRGRVDILLVDRRAMAPTLLAIEVKIRASLAPHRNPVPQVVRYRNALAAAYGSTWAIDPLIVAEHFAEEVIRQADERGIAYDTCAHHNGRLARRLLRRDG